MTTTEITSKLGTEGREASPSLPAEVPLPR
jgi:hypothetical protein